VTDEDAIVEHEAGLHKALPRGQITMMGLGGAIGTGLSMGSVIAACSRKHVAVCAGEP
jgi:L-asparagine transporter-like permease